MSREIKFRAWDKKRNVMCELTTNIFSGVKTLMFNDAIKELQDDYIFLEYTGLKDKNGKEIWEGDVVKLESWEPDICEVVFDRGGFCFRFSSDDNYYPDGKYLEDGEVIGNIYENPELLNHD